MRKERGILFLIVGLVVALSGSAAQASPITWEFAGQLTSITDRDGSLGDTFTVGMPFPGMYTFESTTPDSFPSVLDVGRYEGAVTSISGMIGEVPFLEVPGRRGLIRVGNGFDVDTYTLSGPTGFLGATVGLSIFLGDATSTVFPDDALPLASPGISAFDSNTFILQFESDGDALLGELTALTPEPGAFTLIAVGSLVILRRSKCR